MIRFLQTPGPMLKIILGGVLLIICGSMGVTLVPAAAADSGRPPQVRVVDGDEVLLVAAGVPDRPRAHQGHPQDVSPVRMR